MLLDLSHLVFNAFSLELNVVRLLIVVAYLVLSLKTAFLLAFQISLDLPDFDIAQYTFF